MDNQKPRGASLHLGPQDDYAGPQVNHSVPIPVCSRTTLMDFPIQHQPTCNQAGEPAGPLWMPVPSVSAFLDCPPGLEYLTEIDKIQIHQQIDLLEAITGFETNNKYEIKNSLGQRIYFAVEESDCYTRNCCTCFRPSTVRIFDLMGQEVITLEKPLRCASCCCPCCLQEIEIYSPPGTLIGYVIRATHPCPPKVTVQNEDRNDMLRIVGPFCTRRCFKDVIFEITTIDEEHVVGRISKQWTDFVREALTDHTNFDICFPLGFDVKIKAVIVGACFFIMKTASLLGRERMSLYKMPNWRTVLISEQGRIPPGSWGLDFLLSFMASKYGLHVFETLPIRISLKEYARDNQHYILTALSKIKPLSWRISK